MLLPTPCINQDICIKPRLLICRGKRSDFVKAVQSTVATDLELNGLELESASLTKLDQTDTKFFNPNNAFDAEGLAALTRIVEARRQERNQTVRNAEVAIAQQDLDATQKTLEILRMKKDAELSQQRDIAIAERDRQTAISTLANGGY